MSMKISCVTSSASHGLSTYRRTSRCTRGPYESTSSSQALRSPTATRCANRRSSKLSVPLESSLREILQRFTALFGGFVLFDLLEHFFWRNVFLKLVELGIFTFLDSQVIGDGVDEGDKPSDLVLGEE